MNPLSTAAAAVAFVCTTAVQVSGIASATDIRGGLPAAAGTIPEGEGVVAPFSYVRFCVKNPSDCAIATGPAEIRLETRSWRALNAVNSEVNRTISPVEDGADDTWTAGEATGDCEDYALTKRRRLVAAGIPGRALRLAVVLTEAGEGHAVLVARTDRGDFVLDNRTSDIRGWRDARVTWIKIQSSESPMIWRATKTRPLRVADHAS